MNLLIIFGLCAAVVWVISYLRAYRAIKKLGHHPPAYKSFLPLGLDFLWKFTRSLQNHKDLEFWQNMFLDNGNSANPYTIEVYILGKKIMFTADPENMKAILATQFNDFGKGERFREDWRPFLGASIFTADGQLWHDLRQLVRVQFLKDRVSDLRVFEHHTHILLSKLEGGDKGVNVTDLFLRFTIDAATHFLLGHSIDTLTNPHVKFAEAFAEVQRIQTVLSRMGPFKRFVPKSEYNAHLKVINEFVNPFVEEALSLSPEELEKKTKSDEGYTFLHALAAYSRDRALLRDQIVSVLIAGRDTTASTLSWCIHELSKQPRIVSKLRKEIEDVVGFEKAPTYADLKSMRYLQHTLNETLRLYPVLPFNGREALKDCTLPHGGGPDGSQPIAVPKGTVIGFSTLVMQRRADLYPPSSLGFPDVLEFVPERWDNWIPTSWTYVPFNGGPRICVGQQFALTEMAYTMVRILQRFGRLEDRTGGKHPGLKTDIVLQPAEPVLVSFYE